jgi:pimeloyl-ACP methyl ester carboxylesterase
MSDNAHAKHTLLILHGITATNGSLTKAAAVLERALDADALVVPDLPFHGRGEQLPAHDVPEMLRWFDGLVRQALTRTERLTVIGHSYSAAIMLYWAQQQTETLPQLRLIAVAPPLKTTRTANQFAQAVKILPKRVTWHTFAGPKVKPLIQAYISTYPRRKPDRDNIYQSTQFDDNSYERYVVQVQMNLKLYSYIEEHPILEVHQPTLLLLFGKDLVVDSTRLSEDMLRRGQHLLHVRYVPDAGHLLISQDPGRLVSLIKEWDGFS